MSEEGIRGSKGFKGGRGKREKEASRTATLQNPLTTEYTEFHGEEEQVISVLRTSNQ